MSISAENKIQAINEILDYINSKEELKKKETQRYHQENRETFAAQRSHYLHNKEEREIQNEEDIEISKRNHYKRIGENYESLWKFEQQYEATLLNDVYKLLDIKENDIVVDLGGGTGYWSEKIKQAHQTCDLLLVEPCKKMLDEGKNRKGINQFLMTQEEFMESDIYFNKMMIKECIHHFKDIPTFLDKVCEKLPEGGKALVLTLYDIGGCLPYPKFVHDYIKQIRSEYNSMDQFYTKPWFSQIIHRQYPATISQDEVKRIVKGRFTSTLSHFTDEQIAAGLEEQFRDRDPNEMISFSYRETLFLIEKPFDIKITQEDISHISHKLQTIGISDEVKVGMQIQDLKKNLNQILEIID